MNIVLVVALMVGGAGAFGEGLMTEAVNWKALLPAVQKAVNKEFPEAGQHYAVTLSTTSDVTGMGTTEALIDIGCCGAYTHEVVVMRMEDDKPVFARFRGRDGKISTMVFLAGASVRNGEAVELMPKEHAVYAGHWKTNDQGKLSNCTGEGYAWDEVSKTFNFNLTLSRSLTKDFCSAIDAWITKENNSLR
ncbi:hypothetical protein [Edaphobacter aggregans]|uniref:hypothetical protein n=1 Tax=Edaphobacter aggregans TaxID=570835 RepID=UPI0005575B44|nr:hypothetical protein [Edaphobacter aggregans]